jgi:intracellular septation protein A
VPAVAFGRRLVASSSARRNVCVSVAIIVVADADSDTMKFWTYRFSPTIDGRTYQVSVEARLTGSRVVASDGSLQAEDDLGYFREPYRMQQVSLPSPAGELLFEVAPRTWYSYGLRVSRGGQVLHQSHADPFAYFGKLAPRMAQQGAGGQADVDFMRLKKNAPAIVTDVALGVLFFIAAKLSDLRTAALVAAAAGIALYGVQWLLNRVFDRLQRPRIDLLGGLAMFGIVMLLLSAGFSWAFDSERAVQLKSTYLGMLGAGFFALDAARGATYLGKRLALYLAYRDIDTVRLAWRFAAVGATMALVNAGLVFTVSKDLWLYYNLWGDMLLAIGLSMWAIEGSRRSVLVTR